MFGTYGSLLSSTTFRGLGPVVVAVFFSNLVGIQWENDDENKF